MKTVAICRRIVNKRKRLFINTIPLSANKEQEINRRGGFAPSLKPSPSPYKERGIKGVRLVSSKCSATSCYPE